MNSNWSYSPETPNWGQTRFFGSCDLEIWQVTLKNNKAPLLTLGGTARWLQLQPSSSWPRPTVSAFQYFRLSALTKLAVSHFLHQIYSPSKEEALQSLLMSMSTLVFWLFDEENIRRHDGCNKWWRWLQLMFRERWRGLHDSFDELVPLITQEICFKYFWNLAKIYRALLRWTPSSFFGEAVMMSPHDGGTHLEWVEGRGVKVLSQILSDESLSYSLKHISTGEHSLHISWRSTHPLFPIFKMTPWHGNMFRVTGPLCGEFTGHWWIPLTKASDAEFDVFFDLRLTKRLSKQSRLR